MDWSEGMLTIRGTKFGKSRLVPLHASTCEVLAEYSKRRDRRFGRPPDGPLLVNRYGNRLDKGEVHRTFFKRSRQIGLRAVDEVWAAPARFSASCRLLRSCRLLATRRCRRHRGELGFGIIKGSLGRPAVGSRAGIVLV